MHNILVNGPESPVKHRLGTSGGVAHRLAPTVDPPPAASRGSVSGVRAYQQHHAHRPHDDELQFARDDTQDALIHGRGVEWMRPTDLLARHSAQAAGRGLNFQAEMARRTRAPSGARVCRHEGRVR